MTFDLIRFLFNWFSTRLKLVNRFGSRTFWFNLSLNWKNIYRNWSWQERSWRNSRVFSVTLIIMKWGNKRKTFSQYLSYNLWGKDKDQQSDIVFFSWKYLIYTRWHIHCTNIYIQHLHKKVPVPVLSLELILVKWKRKKEVPPGGGRVLHTFNAVTCFNWTVRLSSSSLTDTMAGWRTLLGSRTRTWKTGFWLIIKSRGTEENFYLVWVLLHFLTQLYKKTWSSVWLYEIHPVGGSSTTLNIQIQKKSSKKPRSASRIS